jgi:Cof subfamily protein (haloacid dehalogenase superfamily)
MTETAVRKPIQAIAVDLDGTLLNSQHRMSERNEKAIKAALDQGIKVIIATGKTWIAARPIIEKLGLKTPGIYVQGTCVYGAEGTLINQQTLEPRLIRQILTFAEERGFVMGLYAGKRILTRKPHPRFDELTVAYDEPKPEYVGALQNVLDSVTVNKIIAIKPNDPRGVMGLRWHLTMQVDGKGKLLQAGVSDMIEVLPPGASKGAMLKQVLKELGIPQEATLAIGDAENDVEMVQAVGVGVAMGNASAHLKEVAKFSVASNDHDGVAEALERFALAKAPVAEALPAAAD